MNIQYRRIIRLHLNVVTNRLKLLNIVVLFLSFQNAYAEVEFNGEINMFYTDDVSIFSASRRLALKEDPTQPLLDRTNVGDDIVHEGAIRIGKTIHPSWGRMEFQTGAQGYLFSSHGAFNHGTYNAQVTQTLPADFMLRLRYYFGPNQYIGKNFNRRETHSPESTEESNLEEQAILVSERVTTHFGTVELERELHTTLTMRMLGRYGNRSYNNNFKHRNTDFWTIGTHLDWEIFPGTELTLGYHFERGLSDGRKTPLLEDDISYRNHFVSAELETHITAKLSMILGFDFEQTLFTTDHIEDERFNGSEAVYQGDVEVRYKLFKHMYLRAGYQHSQRKFTFENNTAVINTVMMGSIFRFK